MRDAVKRGVLITQNPKLPGEFAGELRGHAGARDR
jgi:hypothetical protein